MIIPPSSSYQHKGIHTSSVNLICWRRTMRFSQPSIGQPIISQCLQQEEPFCYASIDTASVKKTTEHNKKSKGSWETVRATSVVHEPFCNNEETKERKEQVAEGGWTIDTHATVRKKTISCRNVSSLLRWRAMLSKGTNATILETEIGIGDAISLFLLLDLLFRLVDVGLW
ncbi:hypothetical protein Tco_1325086 [Tanacetum coccineum]